MVGVLVGSVRKYLMFVQLTPPGNGHTLASTISQNRWHWPVMGILGHCPGEELIACSLTASKSINRGSLLRARTVRWCPYTVPSISIPHPGCWSSFARSYALRTPTWSASIYQQSTTWTVLVLPL